MLPLQQREVLMMDGIPCEGGWMFMGFWWILLIITITVFILWISRRNSSVPQQKSALDILKERYARGEISKNEFEEMKKDLI